MFKKILIANRGEIACRVAATARRLGVRTVAVYSDADAHAAHVAACDEAVRIGENAPTQSYLRWDRIIEAAQETGAEAIHPGYGFLSENEEFALACEKAGLVFIGPKPESIRAMGLKAASKQLMEKAGVPLVPGYHGDEQSPERLQLEADRIGYPVLIKASAGGGGKGMRIVERAEDFAAALASCQREARSSFGNDAVLVEKYVQRPRHVEIQVFGDTHGHVVYLFERDCSVQRRHQKVLEEAPAPGLDDTLRKEMGQAAVAAARAVNYVGAGTVEFIVEQRDDGSKAFFFMEMNTRLQVEHPVTEAITGLDLVEWQLRVASGEPLPLRQDELRLTGHAIEARICAENPEQGFLPATGQLRVFALPEHVTFQPSPQGLPRMDSGVRQGDELSAHYDSMIAKLIVHGQTREQALARLDAALAAMRIVGVSSNVQFLRRVLATDSFAHANLDTALIEREKAHLFGGQGLDFRVTASAVVAHVLMQEQRNAEQARKAGAGPFAESGDWRAFGAVRREFKLERETADGSVLVSDVTLIQGQGRAERTLLLGHEGDDSLPFAFEPVAGEADAVVVHCAGQRIKAWVYGDDGNEERRHVLTRDGAVTLMLRDPLAHADDDGDAGGGQLTAPMPGKIIAFHVGVDDKVSSGQPLAVMEAMKMEHTIHAPFDGVVDELLFDPGDQVTEGAALLALKPV